MPRLARTRRAYIALSWAPLAAILYARWQLGKMEGFAASAAGGYLVLPAVFLSAAMFCAGVLLLAFRRRRDPALVTATLPAGSVIGYLVGYAYLR
ncbi:MAG: hypothetical protein EXQ88_07670 [Alphaproteobacteria bacterium]|nr:hypothetical protein [Alphaproteobacteria bacterium]